MTQSLGVALEEFRVGGWGNPRSCSSGFESMVERGQANEGARNRAWHCICILSKGS
jgi:hypothetical protein